MINLFTNSKLFIYRYFQFRSSRNHRKHQHTNTFASLLFNNLFFLDFSLGVFWGFFWGDFWGDFWSWFFTCFWFFTRLWFFIIMGFWFFLTTFVFVRRFNIFNRQKRHRGCDCEVIARMPFVRERLLAAFIAGLYVYVSVYVYD